MVIQFKNDHHHSGHPLARVADQLLQVSDYAVRQRAQLMLLLAEDDCLLPFCLTDYTNQLSNLSLDLSFVECSFRLRHFRHRHLLRLLLREAADLSDTEETMRAWSDCADAIVLYALSFCTYQLHAYHGVARDECGRDVFLYPLALGKLGGRELNFSSDIDLIFTFSAAGQTDGDQPLSNQHYFTKIIQQFIRLLQTVTVDGFVFRVDLRLRPNGESGPLAMTLAAMETYYQEQGRDWERYAMVKARLIGASHPWFQRLIIPFVYRRYVDFSVIESLRGMKAMIEREVSLNPGLDDLKRGRGGIREIEFIIQCVQLIRGGRWLYLQTQSTMEALLVFKQEKLFAHTAVLQQAYLFFRRLENAVQSYGDQQIHTLPSDPRKQAYVLFMMHESCFNALLARLHQYQRIVSYVFRAILNHDHREDHDQRVLNNQLMNVWQGHVEINMAVNVLTSFGVKNAFRCYQMIQLFRQSPKCLRLTQVSRLRLDQFMVVLLAEMVRVNNTDAVLLNVLQLLENIVGRSAYLALLTENMVAFRRVLYWFERSPLITSLLVSQPFLLDVLVYLDDTKKLLSRQQLKERLSIRLLHLDDRELQEDCLREFKLTCWLLVACAELSGGCSAVRAAQFLADVAEVIVLRVLDFACEQLRVRYPEMMRIKSCFGIIVYGTLGSREMNYDSDLDLVFLYEASPLEERLVTRLIQKMLYMLTMRAQTGVLYAVDTRLRPSGSAGLLVSHLDAFMAYQRTQAWTWEHQALLRARVVFGNRTMRRSFLQLKQQVFMLTRAPDVLQEEVWAMRLKMSQNSPEDTVKYAAGGLLDLEFLVQFLVLLHPNLSLLRTTCTLEHIRHLFAQNVLTRTQYQALKRAYRNYHNVLHQQFLTRTTHAADKNCFVDVLAIRALFQSLS